jgi:hypothetical protein
VHLPARSAQVWVRRGWVSVIKCPFWSSSWQERTVHTGAAGVEARRHRAPRLRPPEQGRSALPHVLLEPGLRLLWYLSDSSPPNRV